MRGPSGPIRGSIVGGLRTQTAKRRLRFGHLLSSSSLITQVMVEEEDEERPISVQLFSFVFSLGERRKSGSPPPSKKKKIHLISLRLSDVHQFGRASTVLSSLEGRKTIAFVCYSHSSSGQTVEDSLGSSLFIHINIHLQRQTAAGAREARECQTLKQELAPQDGRLVFNL